MMKLVKIGVTGHRPNKLGGYDDYNPLRIKIRKVMKDHILFYRSQISDIQLEGYSGMVLGVDQDWAQVCLELNVPLIAVVPFRGQENAWPTSSRLKYERIISQAREIIITEDTSIFKDMRTHSAVSKLLQHRNEVLADSIDELLAFWDGTSGGTANCVKYWQSNPKPNSSFIHYDPKKLMEV